MPVYGRNADPAFPAGKLARIREDHVAPPSELADVLPDAPDQSHMSRVRSLRPYGLGATAVPARPLFEEVGNAPTHAQALFCDVRLETDRLNSRRSTLSRRGPRTRPRLYPSSPGGAS